MKLLAVCALAILAALLPAQGPATSNSLGEYVWWPYAHASGQHSNPTTQVRMMHTHQVVIAGTSSIRLQFANVVLGEEDYIEVVSDFDSHSQKLYPHELAKWENTSAYFNGESVRVNLVLAPGSTGRSFEIDDCIAGTSGVLSSRETICGPTDDRCLSTDWRALRAVSNPNGGGGGCTIWTAGNPSGNCVLSAGHCTGTFGVAEAEVPLSTGSGTAQHPAPNRQWPITPVDSINGGVGNDWAVSTLAPNAQGQLPHQLYGTFTLGFFIPVSNDTTRITGYGSVASSANLSCAPAGTNPSTYNVVNKTHTGPFAGNNGTQLQYATDTTGGNSGSPVIHESTGNAVGIHTHGGCSSTGGANSGTSLTIPSFVTAWNNACGAPSAPTASFTSTNPAILEGGSVSFTDTSSGIPSSWSWDLDGDGTPDSTQQNPTFSYSTSGTYDVSLTVTNAIGSDTTTITGYVTVSTLTVQTLPYSQNFNGGLPPAGSGGWAYASDNAFGRIQTGQSGVVSPGSGGDALTMDSNTDGNFVTNSATLVVDLASSNGGTLTYWIKETADEDHPEDGLWFSDGGPDVLIQAHTGVFTTWTQYTIDLNQAAAANGLSLTSNFRITWRQRDNFEIPTDGHLVDDIDLQPNSPTFSLAVSSTNGNLNCQLSNIPGGTTHGFTMFSLDPSSPVGQGNVFGLEVDFLLLSILATPPSQGNLLHWVLPTLPTLYPAAPFTLPPGALAALAGQDVDGQAVAIGAGFVITGLSNVVREGL